MDALDLLCYRSDQISFQPVKCPSLRLFVLKKDHSDIELHMLAQTRVVSIDAFYFQKQEEVLIFTRESMNVERVSHYVQVLQPSSGAMVG
jgi:hypothetical protein